MSRFVLTLPSNSSMDHFPHNTAARYTTKLVETLELEGAWEVCLLEIASPSSTQNVFEDQCYYTIYFKPGNTYTVVRVPTRLYNRGNQLLDALHDVQRKHLRKIGVMTDDAPLKVNQSINQYSYISGMTKRRPTGYNSVSNYRKH